MRILCVIGTRPEAIKMAPVILELERHREIFETRVCITGQHREMLDQALRQFGIYPDNDLDIMEENQSLTDITAAVLTRLEPVLLAERPDWMLVQGDTTTAMAAALLGYYHHIKVAHVEAGLRTGDKFQPFPEEVNRKIVDGICDLHFAPTETARRNLLREGVPGESIKVTGNTVVDALLCAAAQPPTGAAVALFEQLGIDASAANLNGAKLILLTAHRRENFGEPLESICLAVCDLAERHPGLRFVYPVHPNPNVTRVAHSLLGNVPNVFLLNPLDYAPFVQLLKHAHLVLTDSGGLQEEAPGLGKPVLVLRDVTERPEAVLAGTVRLVGTERARIVEETEHLLADESEYRRMARSVNPYGDGHASQRIAMILAGLDGHALTGPVYPDPEFVG